MQQPVRRRSVSPKLKQQERYRGYDSSSSNGPGRITTKAYCNEPSNDPSPEERNNGNEDPHIYCLSNDHINNRMNESERDHAILEAFELTWEMLESSNPISLLHAIAAPGRLNGGWAGGG
jgi:hypothetical protein